MVGNVRLEASAVKLFSKHEFIRLYDKFWKMNFSKNMQRKWGNVHGNVGIWSMYFKEGISYYLRMKD